MKKEKGLWALMTKREKKIMVIAWLPLMGIVFGVVPYLIFNEVSMSTLMALLICSLLSPAFARIFAVPIAKKYDRW